MKAKGHIPVRTCISCGAKRPKNKMVRLIIDGQNRLTRDDSGKGQGRGAYVCDAWICLERLFGNRRLNMHFRTDKNIHVSQELNSVVPLNRNT